MPLGAEIPFPGASGLTAAILAREDSQAVTLLRLFLIAVVVISPYWVPKALRWWRARAASRAARRAANLPAPRVPEAGSLAAVLAEFEEAVAEGADEATLVLPAGVTVDGRPAPPEVIDTVLRDAIGRSGFAIVTDSVAGGDGSVGADRRIVCRRLHPRSSRVDPDMPR